MRRALRTGDYPRLVEVALLGIALAVVSAFVYGSNAIHGGFVSDARSIRVLYELAPSGGLLGGIEHFMDQPHLHPRPLFAIYLALENAIFGSHMGFWLTWQWMLGVVMSLSLYLLLRELRFASVDAAVVVTLVLVFPAASSLRLWTATVSELTIALAALGFVLALRAFGAEGRKRILWHGCSLALFVASLLVYEIVLPVMLVSVALYHLSAPWRPAAIRWLVDCAVLVPIALLVTRTSSSPWQVQTKSGSWDHLEAMWSQSQTLFATVVMPFGDTGWPLFALVALVPVTAALVASGLPSGDSARDGLRRWLLILVGGLVVVVLGYSIFIPADPYYSPMSPGMANRMNAIPSIGWTLMLYSLARLAGMLVFRGLPHARRLSLGAAILVCALVSVSWLQALGRDADAYTEAHLEGQRVLRTISSAVQDPPPDSAIWAFGQPVEIAPGIPVFGDTWDLRYAVKGIYRDTSLVGYVAFPGTTFACRRDRVVPGGHLQYSIEDPWWVGGSFASRYGRTYFVDTTTGRAELIQTREQCRRAARSFPRSPAFPRPS